MCLSSAAFFALVNVACGKRCNDLDITILDINCELVELGLLRRALPRPAAAVKHAVHFLERLAHRLVPSEEHMDEGGGVECSEDHVHFPVDGPEQWRHGERERAVPGQVGCGGKGYGFGANPGREDLGWVGPGCGAPSGGEAGDEEIGACYDSLGHRLVTNEHPGNVVEVRVGARVRLPVSALERTGDEEPGYHKE